MGINYLYKIPHVIAVQLKLDDPQAYTGHSFRRSSATQLANAGATSTDMRRFYHWKNDDTANRYIDQSAVHGQRIGNLLTGAENSATTSTAVIETRGQEDGNGSITRHSTQICMTSANPSSKNNSIFHITVQSGGNLNINCGA